MPENITWGLIRDLKCTLRFLFSLEWICYCKSQKKNWKNFLNHQLITQIKISLIEQAQVELRAAIFHISCRLRPVQPQKLPRSQPLWSFSSPGTEGPARQPAMRPDASHTFVYRKEQCDQPLAHIPSLLTLQVESNLKMFSRTLSPEALRYLHLGICIGKSHPHL